MSRFIAALPMYDWPEVRTETDAQWVRLRDALRRRGVDAPDALTRTNMPDGSLEPAALWRDPALLFAQTCWGPMGLGLADHVQVIGQPDYSDFEGGQGEFYSSAVVMRRGAADGDVGVGSPPPLTPPRKGEGHLASGSSPSPLRGGVRGGGSGDRAGPPIPVDLLRGKRFAFNGTDSMSGILALTSDLEAMGEGIGIFSERIVSGGHRASIVAVAKGRADVAAIDCRSWAMAQRFEPAVKELAVVGWTGRRKGLPYICAQGLPRETVDALLEAATEAGMLVAS
ncbi:phosphate/phosphite/phosphonate ABC transporter substrate-binding protein [Ollibium composti]|uniref:Phosphate ABC transporter substrate-binding protein n=1 Tax=Ollibium composti TaxID=2675109 RepID=A0ABY2QCW7_9HYPH|nr:PhnD/SsuA/transferrin family substrate-binding protein [Mesorhizobium composti]THF59763.1 phosphate ABC transporter substrate-binding protein [Mesorhizobium composti]